MDPKHDMGSKASICGRCGSQSSDLVGGACPKCLFDQAMGVGLQTPRQSQAARTEVIVRRGKKVIFSRFISVGEYVIGSGPACDIAVAADGVSMRHARLAVKEHEYFIDDLESTNGTYVAGTR